MAENKNIPNTIKVGIVRPISGIDEKHTYQHWEEVQESIKEGLTDDDEYKFDIQLVSDSSNSDLIQNTIIKNLSESDVIIADLSCHNPNVFFEIGVRMAFRKPCILILEDGGKSPFDLSSIRYLKYPQTLHCFQLRQFQKELLEAVKSSYVEYKKNESVGYSGLFTEVKIKNIALKEEEITSIDSLNHKINELVSLVKDMKKPTINDALYYVNLLNSANLNNKKGKRFSDE
jgi:ATP-dependent RNA helicase hrpA|nr:MAG TPA: Blasticidin M [Bacteriophage sp.]